MENFVLHLILQFPFEKKIIYLYVIQKNHVHLHS